jgi:hypothetical protein
MEPYISVNPSIFLQTLCYIYGGLIGKVSETVNSCIASDGVWRQSSSVSVSSAIVRSHLVCGESPPSAALATGPMAAEDTASELEHTGNQRATLHQMLNGRSIGAVAFDLAVPSLTAAKGLP